MQAAIPFPDVSPEIFTLPIFGMEFALRWYALAYIVGIVIGWRLVVATLRRPRLWKNDTPVMDERQLEDLLTWVVLGVILGGRLGYVLFYKPAYFLQNPAEILMLWQGGMSFHGGLLGVITACVVFSWRQRISWLSVADVLCMATPVGLLLGRIANFINAELWGRPTDLPWGVIFPGEMAQYCPQVVGACARHPSQLYEALLEGLILGAVLLWLVFRKGALKRVGTVTGVFFAGYGLARFLVEFVRQPDAQFVSEGNPLGLAFHVGGYGLTMGQILSLPMLVLAAYLVIRARGPA
ncbi:prolipoprotein diacylglyceryl transferase [Roseovarius indicus]|uniref:Phosphatidylglycerol--prolipoprotein diacylglyceryl transferase n=1 Tax=Roseovarius indicus TaxID=540747 RepID=A0A0T5P6V8_9RHOB|nr:prolipoprotein diacylglyceryl transferase [Roseovarius indicus]KRS16654.1 diacylglyceryl transferase [Roseovarius indicus]QEW28308.1 Prolipoprotein diacylglyceryl transferase [Roseovarius indicus]SFE13115.1 Prolipoprotein diacylglyceryl transferase [Roseovarius indicus]